MALLSVQIKKHGGKVLVVTNGRQALRLVPMEKNVEYVINCFGKNTTKVRNIKSYLFASLFNTGSTIGSYYRAEVNHDMPQYVG